MVALTIAGLSACGMNSAEETRAYHGHGVSFAYPARWQEQRVPSSAQDGKPVWSVVFASPNPSDLIVVDAYRRAGKVTLSGDARDLEPDARKAADLGVLRTAAYGIAADQVPHLRYQLRGV